MSRMQEAVMKIARAQARRTIVALCASMAAGLVTAAAVSSPALAEPGQVTWETYLYAGPGQRYQVLDEVPQQQNVDIGSCSGGWCEISYDQRSGFVLAELVIRATENAAKPPQGVLAQPAANLEVHPKGPCFTANQKGGNGGNEMTQFCQQ